MSVYYVKINHKYLVVLQLKENMKYCRICNLKIVKFCFDQIKFFAKQKRVTRMQKPPLGVQSYMPQSGLNAPQEFMGHNLYDGASVSSWTHKLQSAATSLGSAANTFGSAATSVGSSASKFGAALQGTANGAAPRYSVEDSVLLCHQLGYNPCR